MVRGGGVRFGFDLAYSAFHGLRFLGVARRTAILIAVDEARGHDFGVLEAFQIGGGVDHLRRCVIRIGVIEIDAHTIGQVIRRI